MKDISEYFINVSDNVQEGDLKKILTEMGEVLERKNKDYGSASFRTGLIGNYCRLYDKFSRLEQGLIHGKEMNFEGIEDTYKDIIGYAAIGLLILKLTKEQNGNQSK